MKRYDVVIVGGGFAGAGIARHLFRAVGGAVIHDDQLEVIERLRLHTGDRFRHQGAPVVGRDQDGDGRRALRHVSPS